MTTIVAPLTTEEALSEVKAIIDLAYGPEYDHEHAADRERDLLIAALTTLANPSIVNNTPTHEICRLAKIVLTTTHLDFPR